MNLYDRDDGFRQFSLDEANEALDAAVVLSPIDGTVLAVNVDPGEQVGSGTEVATLAEMSDIKLIVNVEQKDISRVQLGQDVEVSIYALPETPYSGIVEKIAASQPTTKIRRTSPSSLAESPSATAPMINTEATA